MPRKRPNYSVLLERNKKYFDKISESEFWKCEYTKRKYILDVQNRPNIEEYDFLKPYGSGLIDHAVRFVMYHADVSLGIDGNWSVDRNELYECLESIIIEYHNLKYGDNPKYYIEDNTVFGFGFKGVVELFGDKKLRSIGILHADARKYGFIPLDLVSIHPLDAIEIVIKNYITEHGAFPVFQSSFLMEKKQDPDIYYKDRNGNSHFADEVVDDAVYVYASCLDEKENIEKIYKRIVVLINMALKNKNVAGDRENSDIQMCFYDKTTIQNKDRLKEIITHSLSAYRNWHSPEKFMETEDTIKMSKYLMVPEYESVPLDKRAAGLWIWDQVHLYKNKLADAIRQARKIKSFKLYDSIDDSSVWRWYKLAKMSIEEMEVLRISDLKEK